MTLSAGRFKTQKQAGETIEDDGLLRGRKAIMALTMA